MKYLTKLRDLLFRSPYYGVPWAVWFYAALACACMTQGGVFTGHLTGYDDHVRMTQVLNWVNGAGWYDRVISRVNAPYGFTTIWSRLVDIPIAAVVLMAQPFMGQKMAALVASVVIPFAELAILFVAARYFARPLAGKKDARLIVLFLMFTSILNFRNFSVAGFHTGEASHHSWYVILNLLLFGAAGRLVLGVSGPAPILMMGAAMALGISVGIEAFPIIAGTLAVIGFVAWQFNRPSVTSRIMQALFAAALFSFLLLPIHQNLTHLFDISFAEPSILGPVLLVLGAIFMGIETSILKSFGAWRIWSLISIFLTAIVASLLIIVMFPQILAGPAVALSPAERALAFREHAEAWPLYKVAFGKLDFLSLMMPMLIAIGAGIVALRSKAVPRRRALYATYLGVTLLTGGLAEWVARYYHHALTSACVWLLWLWQRALQGLKRNGSYNLKALGLFVLIGPFWMLLLPAMNSNAPFLSQVVFFPAKVQTIPDPCGVVDFGRYLNEHYSKDTLLMVPGADSSRLLYHSDLRIDFLNNYPSHDLFVDNETFFGTQDVAAAKDVVRRHGVDLIAVCHVVVMNPTPLGPDEQPMMFERLEYGNPPPWLKEVQNGWYGQYRLYEVDKKALQK